MLGAIKDQIEKGAVDHVEPVEKQFTSTIFLVEKRITVAANTDQ